MQKTRLSTERTFSASESAPQRRAAALLIVKLKEFRFATNASKKWKTSIHKAYRISNYTSGRKKCGHEWTEILELS